MIASELGYKPAESKLRTIRESAPISTKLRPAVLGGTKEDEHEAARALLSLPTVKLPSVPTQGSLQ